MYIERKKTMWERVQIPEEYAKEIKLKLLTGITTDARNIMSEYDLWDNCEDLWDSAEAMSVSTNQGYATEILYQEASGWDFDEIWNNKKIIQPIFNRIEIL